MEPNMPPRWGFQRLLIVTINMPLLRSCRRATLPLYYRYRQGSDGEFPYVGSYDPPWPELQLS